MKPETRVLVSKCISTSAGRICVGIIFRGPNGIDGVDAADKCEALCNNLHRMGFSGELRFAVGDCTCGLPSPPAGSISWERASGAIRELSVWTRFLTDP